MGKKNFFCLATLEDLGSTHLTFDKCPSRKRGLDQLTQGCHSEAQSQLLSLITLLVSGSNSLISVKAMGDWAGEVKGNGYPRECGMFQMLKPRCITATNWSSIVSEKLSLSMLFLKIYLCPCGMCQCVTLYASISFRGGVNHICCSSFLLSLFTLFL